MTWANLLTFIVMAATVSAIPGTTLAQQGAFVVTDQAGRPVPLEAPAARVVTIPMPAAPTLMGIDQGPDSLAAMHPESRTAIAAGLLGPMFPDVLDLPTNVVGRGFMPNVEAVLQLSPDLVIQWGDRGDDLVAPLEAAGLTVAVVHYGGEQEAREWLQLFGALVGEGVHADRLIALRNQVRDRLAPLQNLAEKDKPRVLYLLRARSGLQAAGADTFNDYSIRLAGGRNVARNLNGFKPVNREQILQWDPDIILLNSFEPGLTAGLITDDPLLGLTGAGRSGRVYVTPIGGYRWDPPSHESPLAWLWLADKFHGEDAGIDLRAEVRRIMGLIYGNALTAKALDQLLAQLGADGQRALAVSDAGAD